MITVDQFITSVRSLLNPPVRYAHAGRTRFGIDCIGVIALPLLELGVPFADVSNYARGAYSGSFPKALGTQMIEVSVAERLPGDVILMWWDRHTKEPQHAAILVTMPNGEEGMIHAFQSVGRVVENHLGPWERRITHVFRIPSTIMPR